MPRKIEYTFWLEPPDPAPDEEHDIPAVARELDEKLPEILRRWPHIRIQRAKLPSGLPRVELLLRISNREDSAEALEAVFGIARDLGWEIHDEQTSWTIGEEQDRQELLDGMERAIEEEVRWRLERWAGIAIVPIIIVFCSLFFGALAGFVSWWLFLAIALGSIAPAVLLKRMKQRRRLSRQGPI